VTKVHTTQAVLVLGKDRWGDVKVRRSLQGEPTLQKGERAIVVNLEVDEALWTPAPTPSLTIQVHAPIYPEAVVLAEERPQSPLSDRPVETQPGTHVDG
jgi:hypothetical protein